VDDSGKVQPFQSLQGLEQIGLGLGDGDDPRRRFDPVGFADKGADGMGKIFEDDEGPAVVLVAVEHPCDMIVGDCAHDLRLLDKDFFQPLRPDQLGKNLVARLEDLHGNQAAGNRRPGFIHRAHSAPAQTADHLVPAYLVHGSPKT